MSLAAGPAAGKDPWNGAQLPPASWDPEAVGASAPHLADKDMSPALRAWRRRTFRGGAGTTVAGGVLFLVAVYLIRDQPTVGYLIGAVGVLGLAFGALLMKFAAWGPFPEGL